VKVEVDDNDITEHPHDYLPDIGMFIFCQKITPKKSKGCA